MLQLFQHIIIFSYFIHPVHHSFFLQHIILISEFNSYSPFSVDLSSFMMLTLTHPSPPQLLTEVLSEGAEASVRCKVDANPEAVTYRWFRGGSVVTEAQGAVLPLGVLTRADNAVPVACEVTNSVGTTRKTLTLNVKCE